MVNFTHSLWESIGVWTIPSYGKGLHRISNTNKKMQVTTEWNMFIHIDFLRLYKTLWSLAYWASLQMKKEHKLLPNWCSEFHAALFGKRGKQWCTVCALRRIPKLSWASGCYWMKGEFKNSLSTVLALNVHYISGKQLFSLIISIYSQCDVHGQSDDGGLCRPNQVCKLFSG